MRAAVVIAAMLAAPALADTLSFTAWKAAFGKTYATADEEALRYAIYEANLARVEAHNAAGHSWTMAMNEFGDLTPQEFAHGRIGGYVPRSLRRAKSVAPIASVSAPEACPTAVDWTTKGAVTPVKNQQQCGSCWAFSTTGSVEGANFLQGTKQLISLSEQQLVDCSSSAGNQGCNGGLMDNAFTWIVQNGGLCTEASYPYTAQTGTCKKTCKDVVTIAGHTDVTPSDDAAMCAAVTQQPVSIAVEADQNSFQLYSGGVMSGACGSALDHGVLAVGFGTDGGKEYYKVKNSWGATWGEAGYIRLERKASLNGGTGQCGMLSDPSWPAGKA